MTLTHYIRNLFIILAITALHGSAFAQEEIITVRFDDAQLTDVLKSIESQTPYRFSYRNAVLEGVGKVSVHRSKASVKSVLDEILPPLNLDYKVESPKSISLFKTKQDKKKEQISSNGSVMDAFLGVPLPSAKVELLNAVDSSKVMDVNVMRLTDRSGRLLYAQYFLSLDCGQRYILHGTLDGYEDAWLDIDVPENSGSGFSVGDLMMQKALKKELNEVVVTATKIKMFWKGDTLVYDATAFKMPEGSMLDDLIRQMPGVTLNDDGEIFVNGRKVDELLLGSKSFFRGKSEVLLRNLPYYTVKNIKVYEKSSDLSESLGFEAEPKKYVMDVNLKQEYNSGKLANIEAAAGSSDRYLARAFLLGFSDPFRFSIVGNLNNVNEGRHIGQSGNWTPEKMPKSMLTTRSMAGELKYDNNKVENTLNIEYSSTSNAIEMTRRQETFISGSTPLSTMLSNGVDKNRNFSAHNFFKLVKPWTIVDLKYSHRTFSSRFNSDTRQYNDSELEQHLTDWGLSGGRAWEIEWHASGNIPIYRAKEAYFRYYYLFNREVEGKDSKKMYEFIEPAAQNQYNLNDYGKSSTRNYISLTYSTLVSQRVTFVLTQSFNLEQGRIHDYLYHPDSLSLPSQRDALLAITDFANSYDSRYEYNQYITHLEFYHSKKLKASDIMQFPYNYNIWEAWIDVAPLKRSLRYHRGDINADVSSTTFTLNPNLRIKLYPKERFNESFEFSASHRVVAPSLYDRIDYRDDSQPLVVKLGNPALKGDQTTKASADLYLRGLYGKLAHVGASMEYMHRATAQSVAYDPETGVYTYKPINVSGNYMAKLAADYTRMLGAKRLWTVSNNADASLSRSVDQTMLQGETESSLNKVSTFTLHDGAYVQFGKDALNVRASGDVRWRRSTGRMADFATLSAVDFNYGLSARYTMPGIKTTVSAEGTMYSRRGYGSAQLNTNDFIVNASVSQPLLKGKLVARLEGFDLLHQLSQTQYEVNAQGRVETWYRSLPHYMMLHLVYNLNLTPKKR